MTISGEDNEFTQVEVDTFTIGDNPQITDEAIGDGSYAYAFEFVTPTGDSAMSSFVLFTVANGEITTTVDAE